MPPMNSISGIPYVEAEFDKNGTLKNQVSLPAGVTDLLVISHGWNNDADEARALYRNFFQNFAAAPQPDDLPDRKFAIVGVIWPSKKFDEHLAVDAVPDDATGGASLAQADESSRQALAARLEELKEFFAEPAQQQLLDEAKALLPELEDRASARRAFVEKIRSLLDSDAANEEDASDSFFKDDGNELMENLKLAEEDLDDELAADAGGAASMPIGGGAGGMAAAGEGAAGAAGLKDLLSGFKASAMNVLNYTTYYEMKARAGRVGERGVAKLIDKLAPQVQRIHFIGHSFGGRVVTAAAAGSATDKIKSMTLLQTAFSHNGFSKSMGGFFRPVVDNKRVKGPILVTHTKNDKAVGIAYPLASRIKGDRTAGLGDENDVYGGLGRNGAQRMQSGETVPGKLLAEGANYTFEAGKFYNLEASQYVKDHSDVAGKEIAYAVRRAIR